MKIGRTLDVTNRGSWRTWLQKNYRKEKEVWLVYFRKETGKPRIPYNDAVEEALCFGWIDSTGKKMDKDRIAQRFSPRRPGSAYSQTNKERLARMIAAGKVAADIMAGLDDIDPEKFVFPADIMKALRANRRAHDNFKKFSAPYRRIRIAYIDHARPQPTEFNKRLANFLKLTAQGKQFGFGIESFFD
ncbi:MAG TPA: YdeI/OmpD-associated family protein [Candidatus Binatia bacterium]|nr:YdeI/OmpD-associated family protein [Candidatus Binatia bacterium]